MDRVSHKNVVYVHMCIHTYMDRACVVYEVLSGVLVHICTYVQYTYVGQES